MDEAKEQQSGHDTTKVCTKGHEEQCEYAKKEDCNCDCGGANHGTKAHK